ncbi:MAG: protein kinase, partial [archaeon]|nr:protein kinase [archaeon]
SHPNIVKYIGLVQSSGHMNLILEYVESGSVAKVLAEYGFFPESLAAIYTEQVLVGLEYLHGCGVIHRDIKGGNLLITKEGIIKLADFGLATTSKAKGKGKESTVDKGSAEGSPFWMAPEVIEMTGGITSAADIWSLGCTLIELLTGYPPYFDTTAMNAMWKMVSEDRPPLPDDISSELEQFFLACFEKDPRKRPTASNLLDHPWILKFSRRSRDRPPESSDVISVPQQQHSVVSPVLDSAGLQQSVRKYNELRENPHANTRALANLDWSQPSTLDSPSPPPESPRGGFSSTPPSPRPHYPPSLSLPSTSAEISALYRMEASASSPSETEPISPRGAGTHSDSKFSTQGIKKFSFKDLKDKFEAISSASSDYVVYITGFENQRNFMFSYTVFRMKVCLDQKRWHIYRTFSDFKELHGKIEKALPTIKLPGLPGNKFFGVMDSDFIKQRKNELQVYTESLLKIPSVKSSAIFQFFLTASSQPA